MYSKANYNFQTKLNYWNRSIQSVCPFMHTHNKPGELGRAECRRWWWSSSWVACWTHDALVSDIHDNRPPWRAAKTHVGVRWASRLPNAEKGSPEPLNAQMNRFNWSAPPCIYDARHQRLELDQFGFGVGKKLGRDTRHNFMRTSCCPFVLVSIFPKRSIMHGEAYAIVKLPVRRKHFSMAHTFQGTCKYVQMQMRPREHHCSSMLLWGSTKRWTSHFLTRCRTNSPFSNWRKAVNSENPNIIDAQYNDTIIIIMGKLWEILFK